MVTPPGSGIGQSPWGIGQRQEGVASWRSVWEHTPLLFSGAASLWWSLLVLGLQDLSIFFSYLSIFFSCVPSSKILPQPLKSRDPFFLPHPSMLTVWTCLDSVNPKTAQCGLSFLWVTQPGLCAGDLALHMHRFLICWLTICWDAWWMLS